MFTREEMELRFGDKTGTKKMADASSIRIRCSGSVFFRERNRRFSRLKRSFVDGISVLSAKCVSVCTCVNVCAYMCMSILGISRDLLFLFVCRECDVSYV